MRQQLFRADRYPPVPARVVTPASAVGAGAIAAPLAAGYLWLSIASPVQVPAPALLELVAVAGIVALVACVAALVLLAVDLRRDVRRAAAQVAALVEERPPEALVPGSLAHQLYGTTTISERHRHRYEFNCLYETALADRALRVTGRSTDGKFVEILELQGHPWHVAVQFHPEFKSKPLVPHPLFAGFVEASYRQRIESKTAVAESVPVER